MKKNISLIIMTVLILAMMACGKGGEYTVGNEKNAIAVYKCPSDNMFGLEKVVVFKDRIVTVFDKATNDKSQNGFCKSGLMTKDTHGTSAGLSNLSTYKTTESDLKVKDGKYISTVKFEYDTANKINPDKEVEIIGVEVCEQSISFSDAGISLFCIIWGGECSTDYSQKYDSATEKWGEIKEKFTLYPMTCE